jgi:hypothetical protein
MTRCCILHCSGGYHSQGTPGHCKKAKECCAKLTKKQLQEAQAQYDRRCKEVCNEQLEEADAPTALDKTDFVFMRNYYGQHLERVCEECLCMIAGFCYKDPINNFYYCDNCAVIESFELVKLNS